MKCKIKDPVSALTHLVGAILSLFGALLLIRYAYQEATTWHIVSFIIYSISLISLYTASTIYHWVPISGEKGLVLRKIDHMMIYILIAGTYTPICLISLRGPWGWSLLISIWILAIAGIILKSISMDIPRWLSTGIYIVMGWLVVIAFYPLRRSLPTQGILWLIGGGIVYTLGAVIYALKWPKFTNKWFGFHELFHLFVIGGSVCHFLLMYKYILYTV
jgi:hemolysin III